MCIYKLMLILYNAYVFYIKARFVIPTAYAVGGVKRVRGMPPTLFFSSCEA